MSDLQIEVLEQRIRDHQSQLASLSVEYGDQQMALTKIGERLAMCEGELNALTSTLRSRLEESARARAATITNEANAELQRTRAKIDEMEKELEKAQKAAQESAQKAKAKKAKPKKGSGDKG